MHRRMINPILENMDGERAGYFTDVVAKLENDPRTHKNPNFVFLLLKETMALLPVHLDKADFINTLFAFIAKHHRAMEKVVFDQDYIYDQSMLKEVTNDFVIDVVDLTMQRYQQGEIDGGEPSVQKYTWPYRAEDLVDPDDEEAQDRLQNRTPYAGPERRKKR